MKIEINNLGPIHYYEFDLDKDLNIIFGRNNIGKSYAITAVYLILKNLSSGSFKNILRFDFLLYRRSWIEYELKGQVNFIDVIKDFEKKTINLFKDKTIKEIVINEEVKAILSSLTQETFVISLEKSFRSSFSSIEALNNKISSENFSIIIRNEDLSINLIAEGDHLKVNSIDFTNEIIIRRATTNREPLRGEKKNIIYFNEKTKKLINFEIPLMSVLVAFAWEVNRSINKVYFLPASRSGLYQALSAFSAVIAELSKSRNFLTNRIELPNISEPVSDYFLYLSQIQDNNLNQKYIEIVENIEKDILEGEINFNNETKKIIFSQGHIDVELDLAFTSSMISEIAPIVAFLKYIIDEKSNRNPEVHSFSNLNKQKNQSNLIFIEEPEAHLHPEVQIRLMKLFARLIKFDIKIVMTSHSNYMFNQLSNLILDEVIDYKLVGSSLMRMTDKGSVNDILTMKAEREGINDENFADIAEKLYEERINIYERLNKNAASNKTKQ